MIRDHLLFTNASIISIKKDWRPTEVYFRTFYDSYNASWSGGKDRGMPAMMDNTAGVAANALKSKADADRFENAPKTGFTLRMPS